MCILSVWLWLRSPCFQELGGLRVTSKLAVDKGHFFGGLVGQPVSVMAPKRAPSSYQDSLSPNSPVPPRSASPSSGFTQFLTRPAKWFARTASGSKAAAPALPEPRPSFGSGARKHKISQPTDPRPILDNYSGHGARYVASLVLYRCRIICTSSWLSLF